MANLGLKLYELRKKAKISQEEFAEIVDTSRQAVSKWERDESEPDLNKIILIAKYYNVSIDYLLDYTIDDSLLTEYLAKMEKVINLIWKSPLKARLRSSFAILSVSSK